MQDGIKYTSINIDPEGSTMMYHFFLRITKSDFTKRLDLSQDYTGINP